MVRSACANNQRDREGKPYANQNIKYNRWIIYFNDKERVSARSARNPQMKWK